MARQAKAETGHGTDTARVPRTETTATATARVPQAETPETPETTVTAAATGYVTASAASVPTVSG